MDKILIGNRVRRHRESLKLSREVFSEMVGISPQFLAEIENAKKGFSAETLYKICEKGNVSADYILFGDLSQTKKAPLVDVLKILPEEYQEILEVLTISLTKQLNIDNTKQSQE